jgi:hypothetical protein
VALAKPKNIRLELRSDIANANFPVRKRHVVEVLLVRTVRYYRAIRQSRQKRPSQARTPQLRSGLLLMKARLRGRQDDFPLRAYVFAALFRAWMIGFDEYPKVNNKGGSATPFVIFADFVLHRLGIGKVEDHLEEFRSYRKKLFINSGFKVVRGKVI